MKISIHQWRSIDEHRFSSEVDQDDKLYVFVGVMLSDSWWFTLLV